VRFSAKSSIKTIFTKTRKQRNLGTFPKLRCFLEKIFGGKRGIRTQFYFKKIGYNTLVLILRVIFRVIKTKK
jgi:hypothetical protein